MPQYVMNLQNVSFFSNWKPSQYMMWCEWRRRVFATTFHVQNTWLRAISDEIKNCEKIEFRFLTHPHVCHLSATLAFEVSQISKKKNGDCVEKIIVKSVSMWNPEQRFVEYRIRRNTIVTGHDRTRISSIVDILIVPIIRHEMPVKTIETTLSIWRKKKSFFFSFICFCWSFASNAVNMRSDKYIHSS